MLTPTLTPAGPVRTAFLAALLGTLSSTAATAQTAAASVFPPPFSDVKAPRNSPTIKNGRAAQDNRHLSVEERRSLDAAVSSSGLGVRSADLQRAISEGVGPFQGRDGDLKPSPGLEHHLQLDTDANGMLWAFGGTYKASFDASGATYIPFLGSDAPRNYPVSFRAPVITINGAPIDTLAKADPVFSDTTVVFDRGGAVELYDVRDGELEQLFVFDDLPQRGEIVVRTRFDSELSVHEGSSGLEFVGEHGGVSYSAAIAIDGKGRRSAVSTHVVDGAIELRVPAEFVESAALPLTIDPVIATIAVSEDVTWKESNADIAYDRTWSRWMVIWQRQFSATDNDVFAEAFSLGGTPVMNSRAYVDFTTASWSTPRIANNASETQFLVVAAVAGATSRIFGRTREAENTTMGTPFQISFVVGDCVTPDVGGDSTPTGPTYYMVVWERQLTLAIDHDVIGQLVTVDSTFPNGAIAIDNTGETYDKVPTVSKSAGLLPKETQRWNIVWQRQFSPTDWDIRGAQYGPGGLVVANSFALNSQPGDDRWPQPSSLLDQVDPAVSRLWLAVWQRRGSDGIRDIHGALMKGFSRQSEMSLSSLVGPGENEEQLQPSVDATGLQFVVAWTQSFFSSTTEADSIVAGFYPAGDDLYVSEGPVVLATGPRYQGSVQACARHSGGIASDAVGVAWQDHQANGNHHVGAGVYEALDHYSHMLGVNYCGPTVSNSTGLPARLNASGSSVAGAEPLVLTAWNMPAGVFGYIIGSPHAANVLPGGTDGRVCVGNPLSRFNASGLVQNTGLLGTFDVPIDTESIPTPAGGTISLTAGETFHFQAWFRDGASSNLTDGVRILMH